MMQCPELKISQNGYIEYMRDDLKAVEHIPPLTLSKNYLDFGQSDMTEKNVPHTISITNHTRDNFLLKWDMGMYCIFW